jgi:hypothetical protein
MKGYEHDFFAGSGITLTPRLDTMTQGIFVALAEYEEHFKSAGLSFPLGRKKKKWDSHSIHNNEKYKGTGAINRLHNTKPQNKIQAQALAWTRTNFALGDKVAGELEILLLAPESGTGYLRLSQTDKSFKARLNYNDEDLRLSTKDALNSYPVSANGCVEALFPLGSFLEGDYFFSCFNALEVVYSKERALRGSSDKKDKGRLGFVKNDIGIPKWSVDSILRERLVKGEFRLIPEHDHVERLTPKIILTRGSTPTGMEFGAYSSINNPSKAKDPYAIYQLIGLLRFDPNYSKNDSLRSFLDEHAIPVWSEQAAYRIFR